MQSGQSLARRVRPRRAAALAAAALAILAATGCQGFAPTSLGNSRSEKKIIKQAEVDPFPSPEDVGLGAQSEMK